MLHSRFTSTGSFHCNIGFCTIEVPGGDSKLSCAPFAFDTHQFVPPQHRILYNRGTGRRLEVISPPTRSAAIFLFWVSIKREFMLVSSYSFIFFLGAPKTPDGHLLDASFAFYIHQFFLSLWTMSSFW
ncbi:hypothetical protein BT96DRAFT_226398 [Gymnopus androsaceus JB14]|uniref:Uncharacterized protein n=1 Tax=Gymnopus androsaceus JB14 TaxID=1447944 RepID=A0A6A4H6D9_9AGAR|nr:hypothetical protein BT96DRAFT_226398 [Gymnopus androsaceus JB14]